MPDRILVVDDDQSAFHLAQDILDTMRPGSYDVVWAATYEAGLDALISGAFDLCLLDHGLGDGVAVVLRPHPVRRDRPRVGEEDVALDREAVQRPSPRPRHEHDERGDVAGSEHDEDSTFAQPAHASTLE